MAASLGNIRSPAVRRLMREAKELSKTTAQYSACPFMDNLFEWHFTVRGPPDTCYDGGRYHGRIILPSEYPMKPPSIIILTPNGRFVTNQKICLSVSNYHPESWEPSWSIRTVLLALIGFMATEGEGAVGSIDCPREERAKMAKRSSAWKCRDCNQTNIELLPDRENSEEEIAKIFEETETILKQLSFKPEVAKDRDLGLSNKPLEIDSGQPGDSEFNSELLTTILTGENNRNLNDTSTERIMLHRSESELNSETFKHKSNQYLFSMYAIIILIIALIIRRFYFL